MTGVDTVAGPTDPAVARVLDLELTDPVPAIARVDADGNDCAQAWILVRLCGEPLGIEVVAIPLGGLPALELEYLLSSKWGDRVREIETGGGTAFSAAHARHLSRAPRVSVVVCTRERPDALAVCLASLTRQDHPDFAVWVIDNAPVTGATRDVVSSFGDQLEIHYAVEPLAGLSRARNCALRQPLAGDIVAWIDDDEVADPMWLSELTRALADRPAAAAVSGLVVPAELATRPQLWFEQFGGHSKGRGFQSADFGVGTGSTQSPLYPLPPFGVGANMAFRTEALRAAGGFDDALGAGTLTNGAEDTKIFTELLRAGLTTLYRPGAVTRHYHRRDLAGLRKQMQGYGSGLTAFYTSLILDDPRVIWPLLRLSRQAIRDLTSDSSLRVSGLEDDFPAELLAANRKGMLSGPLRYLRQRAADARRPSPANRSVRGVGLRAGLGAALIAAGWLGQRYLRRRGDRSDAT